MAETNWTDSVETELIFKANLCQGYSWIYNTEAHFYNAWSSRFQKLDLFLSFIGGVFAVVAFVSPDTILSYLSISLVIHSCELLITVIQNKWNFDVKYELMKSHSVRFQSIRDNIKTQLEIPRDKRENGHTYFELINVQYSLLVDLGPQVFDNTYKEYEKIAKEQNMPIPQRQNNLNRIGSTPILKEENTFLSSVKEKDIPAATEEEEKKDSVTLDMSQERRKSAAHPLHSLQTLNDNMLLYQLERLNGHN